MKKEKVKREPNLRLPHEWFFRLMALVLLPILLPITIFEEEVPAWEVTKAYFWFIFINPNL